MTNEEILKEMHLAMKVNNESKRLVNEALCHAANVITRIATTAEKSHSEEYERGTKDAWDLAVKICGNISSGGLTINELESIFNLRYEPSIISRYDYKTAKKMMDDYYESLKNEESDNDAYDPLTIGDVVICACYGGEIEPFEGIFCGLSLDDYHVITKEDDCVQRLPSGAWYLTKTGKRVDLRQW